MLTGALVWGMQRGLCINRNLNTFYEKFHDNNDRR